MPAAPSSREHEAAFGSWCLLFWKTPIGPLRFNFSEALQKETYDKEQKFDLTISTKF